MAAEPRTIKVEPGSELDRLLDVAGTEPVLLERDGIAYRLAREEPEDIWAGYDPEKVQEVVAEMAGSLSRAEADEMIANIYRWREEGSGPADRPYGRFEKHHGNTE